jgi:hypothetical protein
MDEGSPKVDLFAHSAQIAADARKRVSTMLGRHRGVVSSSDIEKIAGEEAEREARKYIRDRRAGYKNNENNYGSQGLTLYLSSRVKEKLLRAFEGKGYPFMTADSFSRAEKGLWSLILPKGVYASGAGTMHIFGEVTPNDVGQYPIMLDYAEVVRIEGDGGQLWQNSVMRWDGRPKKLKKSKSKQ